jgi:thiamine-monophosphate kinase
MGACVSTEAAFITALRAIATSPAARGLADDAAVLEIGGSRLVLTMDAIVEGVHFLADDPPETVAWKLVATNVSDLAAKGALPCGCLLTYPLAGDDTWDAAFLRGLDDACRHFAIPLLGGDTVRQPSGSTRSLALVALGEPDHGVVAPSRSTAHPGDKLWVSAAIGDAGLGLALLQGQRRAGRTSHDALARAYRQPQPDALLGMALAPHVSAMMDVSDGLMIDMQRLAAASKVAAVLELDRVPLSQAFVRTAGEDLQARLFAATAGDDYCLLLAAPPSSEGSLHLAAAERGAALHCVGRIMDGRGLSVLHYGEPIALPDRLGYEH